MHDKHEPSCTFCSKFVLPFNANSPLADWGYCTDELEGGRIASEVLEAIEAQAKKGDYRFFTRGDAPLYQGADEGCEKFEH